MFQVENVADINRLLCNHGQWIPISGLHPANSRSRKRKKKKLVLTIAAFTFFFRVCKLFITGKRREFCVNLIVQVKDLKNLKCYKFAFFTNWNIDDFILSLFQVVCEATPIVTAHTQWAHNHLTFLEEGEVVVQQSNQLLQVLRLPKDKHRQS